MVENVSGFSKANPPAFPRSYAADGHNGMSLRDWFAGLVLEGLHGIPVNKLECESVARHCYMMADALLAERQKGGDA